MLGQANHLIVTCLVGLDAIERGIVVSIPPELHAAWSPKDARQSSLRARRLLLDMALVRSVDALDVYIRGTIRKPRLVQDAKLRTAIDAAQTSVYRKYIAILDQVQDLDPIPGALVDLMIAWRNRSAHSEADNEASDGSIRIISNRAIDISDRFRGLDSDLLLGGYLDGRPPTFKEIASFINATHHFVADVEDGLMRRLDPETYLRELIWTAAKSSDNSHPHKGRQAAFQSIWGKDAAGRERYVLSFLRHQGLSEDIGSGATFNDDLLSRVYAMTPTQVNEWAAPQDSDAA